MAFRARAVGTTLRAATTGTVLRRRLERAVVDPHDASERFDPDFVVGMVCEVCGRCGTTPIRHRREAIREHVETRHAGHDGPVVVRILYPRQ